MNDLADHGSKIRMVSVAAGGGGGMMKNDAGIFDDGDDCEPVIRLNVSLFTTLHCALTGIWTPHLTTSFTSPDQRCQNIKLEVLKTYSAFKKVRPSWVLMFQFSHFACWLMGSSPITSMVCGQGEHGRCDNCYSCVVDVVISPGEVWSRSCHHHHH